ncbi:MAG: acyl-CoA carboxylase subunit beta [Coprococcus sp.]
MGHSKAMSARERIECLLDAQSFVEIGASVHARNTDFNMPEQETPADGVITGYGTIDSNLVYVFSQDASVMGGSIGEMHARKIEKVYDLAMKTGAPVVGMYDCAGLRLQEATDALDALGRLYMKQTLASGVIPQYAAVFGQCGGGTALLTAMSDFTFMLAENAALFVNAPNTLDGNSVERCNCAGALFQSSEAGTVDFVCDGEISLLEQLRSLILMLPFNHEDVLVYDTCTDDLNRRTSDLSAAADAAQVLRELADAGQYIEVRSEFAKAMVTAFIKLNGLTVGAVANRSALMDDEGHALSEFPKVLTTEGMEKAAEFIRFCDAFSIPVLTIVDTTGFETTIASEKGTARAAAKLIHTFADTSSPKITLIAGEAFGSAYLTMNSGHIGADMVFAWPSSHIGMMAPEKAVKIIYSDAINASEDAQSLIAEKAAAYELLQTSPQAAAGRGYVDAVIAPEDTRQHLIAALEMLYTKRSVCPPKKHGTL